MTSSVRVWVDPKFKKLLKINASTKGISILELTKEMSSMEDPFQDLTLNEKKKKFRFGFP